MKALVLHEPFKFEYVLMPIPTPAKGELLLKVKTVGICGTDIHAYSGKQPFFSYPRILGHEICAQVIEVADPNGAIKVGQRVAVIPCIPCYTCYACQQGSTNCCENVSLFGVHRDGGFREYLTTPEKNVVLVPDEISDSAAALIEPFAIAAHAVARGSIQANEDVLVIGAGPIGIGIAAIAKAYGANVIVADTQAARRRHIEKVLSLPTADPLAEDFNQRLMAQFNDKMAKTVIDATGNAGSMNRAVTLLRHTGKLVFVGLFIGELNINDPEFHKRETTLFGSRNATRQDFEQVIKLLQKGLIDEDMMKSHEFAFEDLGDYENTVVKNQSLLKGVIRF